MYITVNGSRREVAPGTTVEALMRELKLKPEITAAQVNDTILQRGEASGLVLEQGDVIELIRIVGGG